MRVLLAGGGSAGHTSPLLATADALRRLDPSVDVTCLGTPRGLENRVVPEAHTDFIFAVLGEELGLVGTLLVLALFLTIAYAGIRVATRIAA